jgi:hypothetical protein
MIHKEGRQPYNGDIERRASPGYVDRQPLESYVSWQSKINSGPNKTVNQEILDNYLEAYRYQELDSVSRLSPGARIAYVTNDYRWRSGGFFIKSEMSETQANGKVYEDGPHMFVLYKSFNNAVFSVQIEDIYKLYSKKPKEEKIRRILFKKPTTVTIYPVVLKNSNGEDTVVYYARDSHNQASFKATKKYINANEQPDNWAFVDGTQELWIDDVKRTG